MIRLRHPRTGDPLLCPAWIFAAAADLPDAAIVELDGRAVTAADARAIGRAELEREHYTAAGGSLH